MCCPPAPFFEKTTTASLLKQTRQRMSRENPVELDGDGENFPEMFGGRFVPPADPIMEMLGGVQAISATEAG